MIDQPCATCGSPIGASLKTLRDERDKLIAFKFQHQPKREAFLKLENELKDREAAIKESEEDFRQRTEKLANDEAALEDLMNESRRPEREYEELRQENLDLRQKVETLTEENRMAEEESGVTIQSLLEKLTEEKKRRKKAVDDVATARRELSDLTASSNKVSLELDALQARYARECDLLETARETISALRKEKKDLSGKNSKLTLENRALESQLKEINRKVTSLSTANVKHKAKIKRLEERISQQQLASFSINDIDLLGALSHRVFDRFAPPSEIITMGSGPLNEADFDEYLKSLNITPCSNDCSWIIVGREDWSEETLNELLENADLDEVRVFSQELFIAGKLTSNDPFSLPLEILLKFAEGHPALEYLLHSSFEWPVIIIEEDYGEPVYLKGSFNRVEESPLFRMGYQVGISNGQPLSNRRSLLEKAYQGKIPNVEDAHYMEEWGTPGHSKRLWRIAHHIAWLIRSRRSNPSMRHAVRDWKNDLDWMEGQFYAKRMRFKWPSR
jgi:hypothetical protein